MKVFGPLKKMTSSRPADGGTVSYGLPVGEEEIEISGAIGRPLRMSYDGAISCKHCGRATNKSFNQGFCYPCFRDLAQCDRCIMSPELCHYDAGTCREPQWGEQNCMIDHIVYLANSSGAKVGITRGTQVPTRWIDQGAIQALPLARVASRHLSGRLEVVFKQHVADKTNWRTMLKGTVEPIDLPARRDELLELAAAELEALDVADDHLEWLQADTVEISYPVSAYPEKIKSLGFDKHPEISGVLQGIKGQYLILDCGVVNMRKHGGYHVEITLD